MYKVQKQPFAYLLQNRCSEKLGNIHRKAHVLESLFNKALGRQTCNFIKKRLQHSRFSVNIAKILRMAFFLEHLR